MAVDSNFAVACFEPEKLDGDTIGEKANKVLAMNPAQFENCVKSSGFAVHVQRGELVVIPPAMLVLSLSLGNSDSVCSILRWGFAGAGDKIRVKEFVVKLMEEYPSLEGADYGVFRKYLEQHQPDQV